MTLKMAKSKTKISLAEQIAALSNPTLSQDPEDESDGETKAQLVDFDDDDIQEKDGEIQTSSLRKKNSRLLHENDKRYAGKATSRKTLETWEDPDGNIQDPASYNASDDLFSDNDEASNASDDVLSPTEMSGSSDEEMESGEEVNTESIQDQFRRLRSQMEESSSEEGGAEDGGGSSSDEENTEEYDEDENEDGSEDEDDEDDGGDDEEYPSNQEVGSGVQAFSDASISEEIAKGKATKTQLTLWDTFMESRIRLQKSLAIANQLPSHDKLPSFVETGGREVEEALQSSSKQLRKLLMKLIDLQQTLLLGNPSTRHIVMGKQEQAEPSDEEITSSEDEDDSAPRKQSQKPSVAPQLKRKADVKDIGEFLTKRHKDFEGFQNETIQKWHEKTKLSTGKQNTKAFSSFEKSPLSQIQQVLQDKPRLIRRTQLRRTTYRRLGDSEENQDDSQSKEGTEETGASVNSHLKDYDEETFDDDDFYHQLLRELIEKRTSSTSDPVQLTRQWLEVQKLRKKIKKKVDTKASKGRKIRYDVHAKLVSFMAAQDTGTMMDEARNELFSSLFGKRTATNDTQ
ncbi:protein AATF-like [Asterias rubens]|uniref:protein AATF-like n=1 Tax=Asterias rubens TaxID=7604 RepID=UPI001455893D|nr:protein AATF-like [Asterias rubens]